jgi:hypothetical protein
MRHGSAPLAWRGKRQGAEDTAMRPTLECSAPGWEIYWTQMRKLSSCVTTRDAVKVQCRAHRLVADAIVEVKQGMSGWADGLMGRWTPQSSPATSTVRGASSQWRTAATYAATAMKAAACTPNATAKSQSSRRLTCVSSS